MKTNLSPEEARELTFALDMAATATVMNAGGTPGDLLAIHTSILASTVVSVAVADHRTREYAMALFDAAVSTIRGDIEKNFDRVQQGMKAREH